MVDTSILADLGLTNAEIKVYIALLELGPSSAGPILDKSGLQNSVVHVTLNRLIEKGLVSYVLEGKRNTYQASNPQHLLDYMEEKKDRFRVILPELLAKQGLSKTKPEVTTYRGIKGIRELLYELLDASGREHHTLGSSNKSLMMGGLWWEQYHRMLVAKKIHAQLLFYQSLKEFEAEKKYPKGIEIRYTKMGFEPLTETIIRGDQVGIIIWTEKPTGIRIQNNEMAQSYDQYFNYWWKSAKP